MAGRSGRLAPPPARAIVASVNDHVIPRLKERHGIASDSGAVCDELASPRSETMHPPSQAVAERANFSQDDIAAFARALMAFGNDGWQTLLSNHAARLPARVAIRDELFQGAARQLGEWWSSDEATMVDVTVATSRLQAALESLPHRPADGRGPRLLLTPAPDDTHVFGLIVLADALREARWSVRLEVRADLRGLTQALKTQEWDAVGIGIAAGRYVEGATKLATALRNRMGRAQTPIIAGGAGIEGNEDMLLQAGFAAMITPGSGMVERVHEAVERATKRYAASAEGGRT